MGDHRGARRPPGDGGPGPARPRPHPRHRLLRLRPPPRPSPRPGGRRGPRPDPPAGGARPRRRCRPLRRRHLPAGLRRLPLRRHLGPAPHPPAPRGRPRHPRPPRPRGGRPGAGHRGVHPHRRGAGGHRRHLRHLPQDPLRLRVPAPHRREQRRPLGPGEPLGLRPDQRRHPGGPPGAHPRSAAPLAPRALLARPGLRPLRRPRLDRPRAPPPRRQPAQRDAAPAPGVQAAGEAPGPARRAPRRRRAPRPRRQRLRALSGHGRPGTSGPREPRRPRGGAHRRPPHAPRPLPGLPQSRPQGHRPRRRPPAPISPCRPRTRGPWRWPPA